ncbi:penicillin-binding protein activator [Salipiger marinus]|jgi:ABC-type branched-subunit amino acid transport system substrate-binding protein|uniref:penicillin-binding protein activator n=1 Tax=Salipiger marinus TaxID=555512 RepID=UPI000E9B5052|nr:penicillin-binding protein activator [Salipiger manganoxidans]MCD1617821.1 penicillin-binding protein activator [Salipiger manganoxidans]MEB3418354.1 penicillin-binding protein activator [Salipiger manganoxidans]HBM59094.1 penicillin-binding protein activator [Citreicella sp.]HBT00848.1 penicillin-binding protein activator [Citreicella sp.]
MFAVLSRARKALRPIATLAAVGFIAACDVAPLTDLSSGSSTSGGPSIEPGQPVRVALLVPRSDPGAGAIARDLENAARLAIADLDGAQIDLAVYDTGGSPARAAAEAQRAVDEGARIILGPLRGEVAVEASKVVSDEGVNVLSFSNNPSIAGGNLFILGPTFVNTADRLMAYGKRQGIDSVAILHSQDVPGEFGKTAIQQAASANGVSVATVQGYPLSMEGVTETARAMGGVIEQSGAESVFISTDATNAAMPILLQMMPEAGVAPAQVQYVGLTRWDVAPQLFSFPGAQGAWFAMPDQSTQRNFNSRYRAAYGADPHPLAGLAFDGIAAIGALVEQGRRDALTGRALTQGAGFQGTGGVFRLKTDGTNERGLAVATVQNNQVTILDPAPSSFSGAGF